MAISLVTILERLQDRLEAYYWTPKIVTITISGVTTGHTYRIDFGGNILTTSIAAGVSDTATTIAASIVTNIKLRQSNAQIGDLTVTSDAGVITITGGAYNFTTPTGSGTGSMAIAVTQAASEPMFRGVRVVPVVDTANIGRQALNVDWALVFPGRERRREDAPEINVADVSVLVLTENKREQYLESATKGARGCVKMAEAVKRDLYCRTDMGSSSPPDLAIKWRASGSPGLIEGQGRAGWVAQEIQFEVEYMDVVA